MKLRAQLFSLAVFGAVATLAGCGGGGGADAESTAPSTEVNSEIPSSTSMFVEPSGVLCAKKKDGVCVEPTSSGATMSQLLAVLSDPSGPSFPLTRYGFRLKTYQKTLPPDSYEFSAEFGSSEKTMLVGQKKILLDGKTYSYSKTLPNGGSMEFNASSDDKVTLPPLMTDLVTLTQDRTTGQATGVGTPNFSVTVNQDPWVSTIGLLTDRSDVNPADKTISYTGSVSLVAADGSLKVHNNSEVVPSASGAVACPITLTLSAAFGKLEASHAHCTDANGLTLNFNLSTLNFQDSQVIASVNAEATGSVDKPAPFERVVFQSNAIGGAIFAKNAQWLWISGSGPMGVFSITARRGD